MNTYNTDPSIADFVLFVSEHHEGRVVCRHRKIILDLL